MKNVKKTETCKCIDATALDAPKMVLPTGVGMVESGVPVSNVEEIMLFELFLARVSTIDRYRIPITDKGLPSAYIEAFKEASIALNVFKSQLKKETAK